MRSLVNIDKALDNDFKNEMLKFNAERNQETYRKAINSNEIFIPTREKRVENILDNFMELYNVTLL